MQKKLIATIVGIALAVSIVGCGKNSGPYTDMDARLTSKVKTMGEYKGLSYSWQDVSVTDQEVEEEIGYELEWYTEYEEIKDRTVAQMGDVVLIDFVGKVNGEEFADGSAEDYDLELGSGEFIPGFEEQIVGKEVGSEFEVNVTFPEDYDKSVAGQAAVFEVKLKKLQKEIPVELTDEFVKETLEADYETVEQYKAGMKEEILLTKNEENRENAINELMEQILAKSEFQIEEADIELLVDDQMANYEMYASMYDMELDAFAEELFGCTVDELRENSKAEVEAEIKFNLVFSEIAKKENLGVTQEEYETAVTAELADYECETIKEFEEQIGKEDYIYDMLYTKVADFLLQQSTKQ